MGGGIFNRKCLLEKTREKFRQRINGYVLHKKLLDVDNFLVRPVLGDELGMVAAAYVGANN